MQFFLYEVIKAALVTSTCRLKNVLVPFCLGHLLMEALMVTLGKPKALQQGPTTRAENEIHSQKAEEGKGCRRATATLPASETREG